MAKSASKPKPKAESLDYIVEFVDPAKLKPHPENYRGHGTEQLGHVIQSIREHGIYKNIVVAADYTILAGHGVAEGCVALKMKQVPVRKLSYGPNDPRAIKVLAGDNEISRLGDVNDRMLAKHLEMISKQDNLLGTGFDAMQFANFIMVTRPADEIKDIDEASQWVGMPDYEKTKEPFKVIVACDDELTMRKFLKLIKAKTVRKSNTGRMCSVWWPDKEREDKSSVKFKQRDGSAKK